MASGAQASLLEMVEGEAAWRSTIMSGLCVCKATPMEGATWVDKSITESDQSSQCTSSGPTTVGTTSRPLRVLRCGPHRNRCAFHCGRRARCAPARRVNVHPRNPITVEQLSESDREVELMFRWCCTAYPQAGSYSTLDSTNPGWSACGDGEVELGVTDTNNR